MLFFKDTGVDLCEDILNALRKLIVNEVLDRHSAGRIFSIQDPEKTDICIAQLPDPTDGTVAEFHKGEQYDLKQCFAVIFWTTCSAILSRKISV